MVKKAKTGVVYIRRESHKKIRIASILEDRTIGTIVQEAIDDYLNKRHPELLRANKAGSMQLNKKLLKYFKEK